MSKIEVKDKNGKTVSKVTKPCKSFVLQFLQLLEAQMYPSVAVTVTDWMGTPYAATEHANTFKTESPVGNTDYGILVGTGTTPVDNLDNAMEALIVHGVGAGELSYGATSKVTAAEVGANIDLQIIRTFSNGSGNTINVTEVGILGCFIATPRWALILHEIVALTAVANGQTLTVTITFRTTV